MKKHPIDDLFAKKLVEFRQEPSQKAFEKFQARLAEKQEKPKGGIFSIHRNWSYYAAAAGIVAVLSIGFLSQKNTSNEATLASVVAPKKAQNTIQNKTQSTPIQGSDSQLVIAKKSLENNIEKAGNSTLKEVKTMPETSIANNEILPIIIEKIIIDDSPEEQNSVATTQIFVTPSVETLQQTETKIADVSKNTPDESIVLILEPETLEEEVIPSLNQDSAMSLKEVQRLGEEKAENDKSFIAKLYGEYKHFKYGEKIDFEKIGLKNALARVDENLFKEDRDDVIGFVQRKIGRLQKKD